MSRAVDHEKIHQLIREGHTIRETARLAGCSEPTIKRVRRELGLTTPHTRLTEAQKARAAAMIADGCSYREIARTLGTTAMTIRRHYPDQGWSYSEGQGLAVLRRQEQQLKKVWAA